MTSLTVGQNSRPGWSTTSEVRSGAIASGNISTRDRSQGESSSAVGDDDPATVVSLSFEAKTLLAQAEQGKAVLEAWKQSSSTAANSLKSRRTTDGTAQADAAGAIFRLITNGDDTAGFVVNPLALGGSGEIGLASRSRSGGGTGTAASGASDTSLPAGWSPTWDGSPYSDAKEAQPGDSPAVRFQKLVSLLPDGLDAMTNLMTPEGKASFTKALAEGTVQVNRAEDVQGLNYRTRTTPITGAQGQKTGETLTLDYNQSSIKAECLISGDRLGGLVINWPGAPLVSNSTVAGAAT